MGMIKHQFKFPWRSGFAPTAFKYPKNKEKEKVNYATGLLIKDFFMAHTRRPKLGSSAECRI